MLDKILVDDTVVNRKLLVHILQKEGHDLIEAADGEEAVDWARAPFGFQPSSLETRGAIWRVMT